MVKGKGLSFRAVGASFVVILALLIGGTLGLIYLGGPTLVHFPSVLNVPIEPWMKLIPSNAEAMSIVNLSAAFADNGNASQDVTFLNIYQTQQIITGGNVTFLVTYDLPPAAADQNSTEVFYFQTLPTTFQSLRDSLTAANNTARETFREVTIFYIYNNNTIQGGLINGRICFLGDFILYTQGATADADIKGAINVNLDNTASLFSNQTIQRALYASTNNNTGYIGFSYNGYATEVQGVQLGAKSVFYNSGKFEADYAYKFKDAGASSAALGNLSSVYSGGFSYYLMDEYVVAKFEVIPSALLNQLQTF